MAPLPLLPLLLSLLLPSSLAQVDSCFACTSDDGSNKGCEGGPIDANTVPTIPCTAEYGNQYCFVTYTRNKKTQWHPTETTQWNRGCCRPKAGTTTCPTDWKDHENNDAYELYRLRCAEDNCNIGDPRTDSGSGGDWVGGLVVPGRSSSSALLASTLLLSLPLLLTLRR